MKNGKLYILIGCAAVLLLVTAAFLIPAMLGEKEPDRSVRYEGSVQKFSGEVLFISKHENGYVIYMDQREHQPNSLMEFWIFDETHLFDDQDGEYFKKMLEEQQTGATVLIGSYDPQENILDGHSVRPVLFMYDKTPEE